MPSSLRYEGASVLAQPSQPGHRDLSCASAPCALQEEEAAPPPPPSDDGLQRSCCACSCASAVWGTLVGLSEGAREGLLKAADLGQWAVDATMTALGITTITDPTTTTAETKGTSHADGAGAGRGAWSIDALFV
jgi:hypothetical protein